MSLFLNYRDSALKQLQYYRQLGENTFAQLTEAQLLWAPNAQSNSIAVIVNHLSGNMKSRWTDFLTTDGEKDFRQRDQEFEEILTNEVVMLEAWHSGWAITLAAIEQLQESDAEKLVYIRNIGHSIPEAINRQLMHYAYHIGQIVYLGRLQKGENWQSLSILKGQSAVYNAQKFEQPKHRGHFTDEFLDPSK